MTRRAPKCIPECQHPDACSGASCWIMDEMYEEPEPPARDEEADERKLDDPRRGQGSR